MVFFVIDTVPLELGVLHVHTNPFEHDLWNEGVGQSLPCTFAPLFGLQLRFLPLLIVQVC